MTMDSLNIIFSNKLTEALVFTIRPGTTSENKKQLFAVDNKLKARVKEENGTRNPIGKLIAMATLPPASFTPDGLAPMYLSAT